MSSVFSLVRRTALGAVLAGAAFLAGAPAAGAQTVSASYAPECGPGTACTSVSFLIENTTGAELLLDNFTFTIAPSAALQFAATGGFVAYVGGDDMGLLFGGASLVDRSLTFDFLTDVGGPFTLGIGSFGTLSVQLAEALPLPQQAFSFSGTTSDGGQVAGDVLVGDVSVVPEPSTYLLMATGLGVMGLAVRRRRVQN